MTSKTNEGALKPSNFTDEPYNSVLRKSEAETVARNIMVILERTGDNFRELSFEEYKEERTKDGNFTMLEKQYFHMVIDYCKSAEAAVAFSTYWPNK